jgi:hypothetical protein
VTGAGRAGAAIALAWGLVLAVAAYAIIRAVQAARGPQLDPAAVAWSPHAGFFWRSWTAAYIGGMGAFAASLVARGRIELAARALAPAAACAATLLALVTLLCP